MFNLLCVRSAAIPRLTRLLRATSIATQDQLSLSDQLEHEQTKSQRGKVENSLRQHNLLPVVFQLLKALGESGQMGGSLSQSDILSADNALQKKRSKMPGQRASREEREPNRRERRTSSGNGGPAFVSSGSVACRTHHAQTHCHITTSDRLQCVGSQPRLMIHPCFHAPSNRLDSSGGRRPWASPSPRKSSTRRPNRLPRWCWQQPWERKGMRTRAPRSRTWTARRRGQKGATGPGATWAGCSFAHCSRRRRSGPVSTASYSLQGNVNGAVDQDLREDRID